MSYRKQVESLYKEGKEEDAISILESFCKNNPLDLEAKFDLALLNINTSIYADSHIFALELLNELLVKSHFDIKSLLLKAYIEDMYLGDIKDETLDLIEGYIVKLSLSEQYYNLLFLAKAFYYREKYPEKYCVLLLDYIERDILSSLPYYLLGKYFKSLNRKNECKDAFGRAYSNVKVIFKDKEGINPINFDEFIDHSYRGVLVAESHYKWMLIESKC